MALSTGSNKIKTAIFISGTGSNLKSLIKFSKLKKSPIIIKMIISNNSKAKGLKYAKYFKIKNDLLVSVLPNQQNIVNLSGTIKSSYTFNKNIRTYVFQ